MKNLRQIFLSERIVMVVILLNALIVFMMYFPAYSNNLTLELIDHAFLLFFIIEVIVKLSIFKPRQYFSIGWNRFDFAIVVASLPSVLVYFLPVPNTSLLIILRLFRLIRLIRFIRFIPDLNKVMLGLGRALRASVFVLLALVVLNFLLAIFTCHFYAGIAPEYFGDPLLSAYSIFQMFTVEGWHEIAGTIAEKTGSPLLMGITRFYFVLVVLVGGIFGMSLANAVFVDEMTMDNTRTLEDKVDKLHREIMELKEMLKKR
ncbi:MAG: ion transporter [Saprospiraceae bacterium]|nr:ion transporter [Saprospiraceae bacterium]